jgi:hypothetical protein
LGRGWKQIGGFWEFLGSDPGDHCPGGKDRAANESNSGRQTESRWELESRSDRGHLEEGSASNRSHSWNLHS